MTTRVYDPRVQRITFRSPALGINKTFYIYLPPGYDTSTERYPTLYLFRGHEREWVNKRQDTARNGENVIDVYERLLQAGHVGSMILVMPGISSADNRLNGIATNFLAPHLSCGRPGIGTGRFEDYLMQDLIPYVDRHYRTLADPAHRGVDGFSLGGFMSVKLAVQHPELFSSCGAYDGLFFYPVARGKLVKANDKVYWNPIFDPVFGLPRDRAYTAAHNGPNLVLNAARGVVAGITWLIEYGPEQREPYESNFYRGEELVRAIRGRGGVNRLGVRADGRHNWGVADRHMQTAFPLHWRALRRLT